MMATLHIRGIPEGLHARLLRLARAQHRSLSAQVVVLLEHALEQEDIRRRQGKLLADIRRRRFQRPSTAPSSFALLREDRRR